MKKQVKNNIPKKQYEENNIKKYESLESMKRPYGIYKHEDFQVQRNKINSIQVPKKQQQKQEQIFLELRLKQQAFQFSKLDKIKQIDEAYFLIGGSRAGKTTLSMILKRVSLQSRRQNGNGPLVLEVTDPKFKDMIGHGRSSKTKMPNILQIEVNGRTIHIIDCPGLLDSQGFKDDFVNYYFVMKIFEVVKSAKFLFCIPQDQIKYTNIAGLIKSLSGYLRYFKSGPHLDKIINATSLVITKCLELSAQGNTAQLYLEQTLKTLRKGNYQNHAKVLEKLVNSKRVYYQNKITKPGTVVFNEFSEYILKNQSKKDPYKLNQNNDISFQVSVSNPEQQQGSASNFIKMYQSIKNKLAEVATILKKCYKEVVSNITKNRASKTFNYVTSIQKYIAQNDIYKESSNNKQARKNKVRDIIKKIDLKQQIFDFAEILFVRAVCQANTKLSNKNRGNCISLLKEYLKNVISFGYLSHNAEDMFSIAYLIRRNIEELNSIEKICPQIATNQKYRIIHDQLQLDDCNVQAHEVSFIQKYTLRQNSTLQYLKAAYQFFQSINLNGQPEAVQIQRKNMLLEINIKQGGLQEKQGDPKMAFKHYQSARKNSQKLNAKQNDGQIYSIVNTQLYFNLATICQKYLSLRELAVEYYKVIDYKSSIRRCFDRLRMQKQGQELLSCYLSQADYYSNSNCPEEAKRLLEEAIQVIPPNNKGEKEARKKVKELQLEIGNKQAARTQKYLDRIKASDFYNRPNETYIKLLQQKSSKALN